MKFQDLALLTVEERSDYIRTAAAESGLAEFIIEKDFWVVWLLEQLFALSSTVGPFTFKGGTSLSKGSNVSRKISTSRSVVRRSAFPMMNTSTKRRLRKKRSVASSRFATWLGSTPSNRFCRLCAIN